MSGNAVIASGSRGRVNWRHEATVDGPYSWLWYTACETLDEGEEGGKNGRG